MAEEDKTTISYFDPFLPKSGLVLLIGGRSAGKSTTIKELLQFCTTKGQVITAIGGQEDVKKYESLITTKHEATASQGEAQLIRDLADTKTDDIIVLDNLMLNRQTVTALLALLQDTKRLVLCSSQYPIPQLSKYAVMTILFQETSVVERIRLHRQFWRFDGSNYSEFDQVMRACTENYNRMVILNKGADIEKSVFCWSNTAPVAMKDD